MSLLGFSINLLILFGLVLAVGLVVDDAIVVLENTQRHIQEGKDPRTATEITMIEVFGAVGGRFDHTFANVQLLSYCKEKDVNCTLCDNEIVFIVRNECVKMPIEKGTTVSVFSLSVKANNVTLKGFKYPLEREILTSDFPLGVSNVSVCDEIEISVEDGTLLVVISH